MPDSPPTTRSIVLVTVDSLRADYCYSDDVPTPALDALAADGVRFETAIAPGPATYESMPAIFTGVQPGPASRSGGINKRERIATHLQAHRPIPERLRERGYTTVGVTPNPFTSRLFGFDTGFDRFVDFFDSDSFGGGIRQQIVTRWAAGEFVGGLRFASNMLGLGDASVNSAEVVSRSLSALEDADGPVFLWLMFLDPHWPYRPPHEYREGVGLVDRFRANWRASNLSEANPTARDAETIRRLYRGTIRAIDDSIATLRERLDAYDPVFVVHADHGEAFGEHGRFGHGGLVYEENVRVPLIVGNVGASADADPDAPISLRSIPRLVEALAAGETDLSRFGTDRTYATAESDDLCIRGRGWKYYVDGDGDERLYDLRTDPGERTGTGLEIGALGAQYRNRLLEMQRLERATRERLPLQRL